MTCTGKVAIVTGAARGIGRACAFALADAGFDVAVVDLLVDAANETADAIRATGVKAMAVQADVSSLAAAHLATASIADELGRIDVLVNNAGRACPKGLLDITEEEWDLTLNVNLKSCFAWCRATVPHMREIGGGRIINIASINGINGGVTSAVSKFAYASAKAGVLGMTKSLAKELGPQIVVNAVSPGIIKTEITTDLIAAREDQLAAGISLGRTGVPEDIAQVVRFLASVEPNFMTGQNIVVDGNQWVA